MAIEIFGRMQLEIQRMPQFPNFSHQKFFQQHKGLTIMEEEQDLLASLEAMANTDIDLGDFESTPVMSVGDEDSDSNGFLNEYESTFNFIDSELDALCNSFDNESSPRQANKRRKDTDDSSYTSSSDDKTPFQMPDIDQMSYNMGVESEPGESSEREEEVEESTIVQENEDFELEEIETVEQPVVQVETTEEIETQADDSTVQEPVQSVLEEQPEQDTIKKPLQESPVPLKMKPQEKPQVKKVLQVKKARSRVPPRQLDQTKKPSNAFHFLTTLFSIALAFLTGQRFPKQDQCQSLEMAGTKALLQPHEFQTIDLHLNKNYEQEDVLDLDQVLFDTDYCELEEDFSPLFTFDNIEIVESQAPQLNQTEAIVSLYNGDKAAHAAAIHQALEEQEKVTSEELYFDAVDFFNEDTEFGVWEETFFGEINAFDWVTPKVLGMMQTQNMETVYVMYEEQPYAEQSINLHYGLTEYEGLIFSMEMIQFIEPSCAMPLLLL